MSSDDHWMQAVQAGDVIRRHSPTTNHNSNSLPPGVVPGLVAAAGTALLTTWPLRKSLFRYFSSNNSNNKQFQMFLELIVTPIQVLAVVQVGLFVGSVYGSHVHLQQFLLEQEQQPPSSSFSEVQESVCRELLLPVSTTTAIATTRPASNDLSSWNPLSQILHTHQQVLYQCRRRSQQNQHTEGHD